VLALSDVLALAAAVLASAALVVSSLSLGRSRAVLSALQDLQPKVRRICEIEDAVVRSVMEEEGSAYVEAVLRTAKRLHDLGYLPEFAIAEAQKLVGRKMSQ